jgi:uncharacterized protein (DUF983 family)
MSKGWSCPRCGTGILLRGSEAKREQLNQCVICAGTTFYREKSFPKFWRFFFLGTAIVLSFFTYGFSLMAFALLDLLFYQFLPWVQICYLCESEYHGFPRGEEVKPFDPHKGVAYDARRAIPKF